ncbi:BolA/IbaG family iron-sulfur metabolism protein [Candidatus Woesearchaeota archaeon]|nr:BolA/IbaG family iron-sulfur metabolism protein [Candidatus Woesearchaeota archaeon]
MDLFEKIKVKIETALQGAIVEVRSERSQHIGHGAGGAHVGVKVIYDGFKDKSMVEQHQMIYTILKDEMKQEIHSLQIETRLE